MWIYGGIWGDPGEPWGAMEKTAAGGGGNGDLCGSTGGTRGHEGQRQTWEGVKGDPGEWGARRTRRGGHRDLGGSL